jgi:hypothetical protein
VEHLEMLEAMVDQEGVVALIPQDQVVLEDQETHQAHHRVKETMVVLVHLLQELLVEVVELENLEILMD